MSVISNFITEQERTDILAWALRMRPNLHARKALQSAVRTGVRRSAFITKPRRPRDVGRVANAPIELLQSIKQRVIDTLSLANLETSPIGMKLIIHETDSETLPHVDPWTINWSGGAIRASILIQEADTGGAFFVEDQLINGWTSRGLFSFDCSLMHHVGNVVAGRRVLLTMGWKI